MIVARRRHLTPVMCEIINLTPHDVVVVAADGSRWVFPSQGKARVEESAIVVGQVCGIPLVKKRYLDAKGLPPPVVGRLYVVSYYTRACCPDRRDLLVPHDLIRDDKGNIVACRAFSIWENVAIVDSFSGETDQQAEHALTRPPLP